MIAHLDVGRVGGCLCSRIRRRHLQSGAAGMLTPAGLASLTLALAPTASFQIIVGLSVDGGKTSSRFRGTSEFSKSGTLRDEHRISTVAAHLQVVLLTAAVRILSNTAFGFFSLHKIACDSLVQTFHLSEQATCRFMTTSLSNLYAASVVGLSLSLSSVSTSSRRSRKSPSGRYLLVATGAKEAAIKMSLRPDSVVFPARDHA